MLFWSSRIYIIQSRIGTPTPTRNKNPFTSINQKSTWANVGVDCIACIVTEGGLHIHRGKIHGIARNILTAAWLIESGVHIGHIGFGLSVYVRFAGESSLHEMGLLIQRCAMVASLNNITRIFIQSHQYRIGHPPLIIVYPFGTNYSFQITTGTATAYIHIICFTQSNTIKCIIPHATKLLRPF